jgi:hypothetical protein
MNFTCAFTKSAINRIHRLWSVDEMGHQRADKDITWDPPYERDNRGRGCLTDCRALDIGTSQKATTPGSPSPSAVKPPGSILCLRVPLVRISAALRHHIAYKPHESRLPVRV